MGLDNIPYEYPCIAEGLQAEDEDIDCDSNIDNNKCPWHREMVNAGMATYGMLGTPCWFRGKVGNFMLQELAEAGYKTPLTDIGENIFQEYGCVSEFTSTSVSSLASGLYLRGFAYGI